MCVQITPPRPKDLTCKLPEDLFTQERNVDFCALKDIQWLAAEVTKPCKQDLLRHTGGDIYFPSLRAPYSAWFSANKGGEWGSGEKVGQKWKEKSAKGNTISFFNFQKVIADELLMGLFALRGLGLVGTMPEKP